MAENLTTNSTGTVELKKRTPDEAFQEISEILTRSHAQGKEVTLETRIAEDLGADSLDTIELVMELEKHFGCTISDGDAQQIKTVGDIVNTVVRLSSEGKA